MLDYAKYDWIALLDVDDKWKSDKLQKQVKYMDDYDVIGTKCKYFGNKRIINSSCLIRKELCSWDSTSPAEDYDLWLKLKKQNCRFFNHPDILVLHRIHGKSYFNSTQKNNLKIK